MAKAQNKTQKTDDSVEKFLNTIKEEEKRNDCFEIVKLMQKISGDEPRMWGAAIIGFGNLKLKYESGRELDWFKFGFSPRKQNIVLYGVANPEKQKEELNKLGKHKTGKGCLYINSLKDIDIAVFQQLIKLANERKNKNTLTT